MVPSGCKDKMGWHTKGWVWEGCPLPRDKRLLTIWCWNGALWWHLRVRKKIEKDDTQRAGFERGVQPKRAERFLKIWYWNGALWWHLRVSNHIHTNFSHITFTLILKSLNHIITNCPNFRFTLPKMAKSHSHFQKIAKSHSHFSLASPSLELIARNYVPAKR